MITLGTLEVVDLRTVWAHEALVFTKWLSKQENIELLCDELEIEIEDIKVEEATGRYNADIVGVETTTKKKIIIENQLEGTDHKHLGQIITYASGLDASIIIWIAKDYNDEHKAAIDWLNKNMSSEIRFFLIQIELWKIGNSNPAPRFNVISKPNDWVKTIKSAALSEKGSPSELKLQQQQFWQSFKDFVKHDASTILNLGRTPRPQHWYTLSIGTSRADLSATVNSKQQQIGIELYIKSDSNLYRVLKNKKDEIEEKLGTDLQWMDLPDSVAFRILKSH
ncbi:MAG: hypothetical protein JWR18_3781, partial [Segetibacter sp.]|nr:hypothetical protein [Segetibacter sp.]